MSAAASAEESQPLLGGEKMAPAASSTSEESRPLLSSPPSRPALLPQLLAAVSGGLIAMVVGTTVSLPSSLIPQVTIFFYLYPNLIQGKLSLTQ